MTKDQTVQKRTEPAFVEPMQCTPVTALPAGEKWIHKADLHSNSYKTLIGGRCLPMLRLRFTERKIVHLPLRRRRMMLESLFAGSRRL